MRAVRARALKRQAKELLGSALTGKRKTNVRNWFMFRKDPTSVEGKKRIDYQTCCIVNTGHRRLYRLLKKAWLSGRRGVADAAELLETTLQEAKVKMSTHPEKA